MTRVHTKLMAILFWPTWFTTSETDQALFRIGDTDVGDGAGEGSVRIALGAIFRFGRLDRLEVRVRDGNRRRSCPCGGRGRRRGRRGGGACAPAI